MINIISTPLGTTRGHAAQPARAVTNYALIAGDIAATVWDYGAHLVSCLTPDREGHITDIVRCRGALSDYDTPDRDGYMGATVGRYANRIAGGRFTLDGVDHQLATNDGPNHLHGGDIGFDQFVWDAEPFELEDSCGVRFDLHRPDGDEGYPGAIDVSVTYTMREDNSLSIDYAVTCDAPTIVNLTNHAYWNLAGAGFVNDHVLAVHAARYLAVDETMIPDGPPRPVAATPFDFSEARPIGPESYDHCFVLDDDRAADVAVELSLPGNGRTMTVETDQPGVQLYTANHLPVPRTALCLEAQRLPDTPNRPDFGSAVLRPGETYTQHTVHRFGVA